MARRKIVILGSTGSVGVSTLDFLEQAGADVEILALTGGRNIDRLVEQARRWRPGKVVIEEEASAAEIRQRLAGTDVDVAAGAAAIVEAAGAGADWVMSAIVGAAGLAPTLAAARSGAVVGLANKESLVCAGPALLAIAREAGGQVIPVDSEHSAIFQVLEPHNARHIRRLILTASGGPFRTWTAEAMAAATPEQAITHPNWSMGPKISVDSATLMNKGLELIEAAYLFSMPATKVDVVIHPQSIVHSMVEYADGSTLAQLGPPDMRTPIACAWSWPARTPWPAPALDLAEIGTLTFQAPDAERFPALNIARQALDAGPDATATLNAANEVAVRAFLDRRIGFLDITSIVLETLDRDFAGAAGRHGGDDPLRRALLVDSEARRLAAQVLSRFERKA